jgi:hypothetical protein
MPVGVECPLATEQRACNDLNHIIAGAVLPYAAACLRAKQRHSEENDFRIADDPGLEP